MRKLVIVLCENPLFYVKIIFTWIVTILRVLFFIDTSNGRGGPANCPSQLISDTLSVKPLELSQ